MQILKIALLCAIVNTVSFGQIVIEEIGADSGTTVQFTNTSSKQKSEWGPALLSLLEPGCGQFMLNQKSKGIAYLSADMISLAGVLFSEATSRRGYNGSISYARTYALTGSSRSWDDRYWNDIGFGDTTIMNIDDWNDEVAKGREFDQSYDGENPYESEYWKWNDRTQKDRYNELRRNAKAWHITSLAFVGCMSINRIISFIDARVSAGRQKGSSISGLQIVPAYSLENREASITVTASFRK